MAVLYIEEYARNAIIEGTGLAIPQQPPITSQTIAIGVGSVQSTAFNSATRLVRIHSDAICSISFGLNPTAAATTTRMAAGQTEYFAVQGGQKVAVITNT